MLSTNDFKMIRSAAQKLESEYKGKAAHQSDDGMRQHWLDRTALADVIKDITAQVIADINASE